MTTVLVTGATGYIGSHVCKHLKSAGHIVIGVDRVRREHTLKYMDQFVEGDYAGIECFNALFEYQGIKAIVHCAGTSLVGPSMTDPAEYYMNNVAKTAMFLDLVRSLPNRPVVVFSSSAAVYGAPDVDVITEEQSYNPMSPYGQSKAMIELMLVDFSRAYGLKSVCLRYFNACGADVADADLGQEAGATHIFARLLEAKRDNKEFTLFGTDYNTPDGTCVRDYVHVDDLANAHIRAIDYLLKPGSQTRAINLGSGDGISNKEIIQAVEKLVGPMAIIEMGRRPGDPDKLIASNKLAEEVLGWKPTKNSSIKTIINSAWKWYNNPSNLVDN